MTLRPEFDWTVTPGVTLLTAFKLEEWEVWLCAGLSLLKF